MLFNVDGLVAAKQRSGEILQRAELRRHRFLVSCRRSLKHRLEDVRRIGVFAKMFHNRVSEAAGGLRMIHHE
jgi:hypothetical protein